MSRFYVIIARIFFPQIHVCSTPPNTMFKVKKHITECQNEVKTNIFNEAFTLIHDHAFLHPDDTASVDIGNKDEFAHPNFTLTELEILKFFQSHSYESLGSSVELSLNNPTEHELLHSHNLYAHPQPVVDNIFKKTDTPENGQHTEVPKNKRNSFSNDMKTDNDETIRTQRHVLTPDIHLDLHYGPQPHLHADIHPTTATFKDKRIAGVSYSLLSLTHCPDSNRIQSSFS